MECAKCQFDLSASERDDTLFRRCPECGLTIKESTAFLAKLRRRVLLLWFGLGLSVIALLSSASTVSWIMRTVEAVARADWLQGQRSSIVNVRVLGTIPEEFVHYRRLELIIVGCAILQAAALLFIATRRFSTVVIRQHRDNTPKLLLEWVLIGTLVVTMAAVTSLR